MLLWESLPCFPNFKKGGVYEKITDTYCTIADLFNCKITRLVEKDKKELRFAKFLSSFFVFGYIYLL